MEFKLITRFYDSQILKYQTSNISTVRIDVVMEFLKSLKTFIPPFHNTTMALFQVTCSANKKLISRKNYDLS